MVDTLIGPWKKRPTCEMVTLALTTWDDYHKIDIIISHRFSIQLMKTGRMKGQAFIGLPSEAVAAQALRETNGYLLRGKPIIVVRYTINH